MNRKSDNENTVLGKSNIASLIDELSFLADISLLNEIKFYAFIL
jgi:hypothetical protein